MNSVATQIKDLIDKAIKPMNVNDKKSCTIHAHPNIYRIIVHDESRPFYSYIDFEDGLRQIPIKKNEFVESLLIRVDN